MITESWSGEIEDEDDARERCSSNLWSACINNSHGRLADQVKAVLFEWSDHADDATYAWIVELKDGRLATVSGSHDYTGWDCVSNMSVDHVAETELECVSYLTDEPRRAWEEEHG